jgi:PilZ domain
MSLPTSPKTFHVREFRRFPVNCLLYFSSDEVYGKGTVWNVSLGGWRADSEVAVAIGTTLTLFIMLPDTRQAVLVDEAVVCWRRGYDFGLAIRKITPNDATRLRDFVAEHV